MRRRYGIPDHDQRPFNVAYAAAKLAQDDSRKMQDRMRNLPTFEQPNLLSQGSTGPGMVIYNPIILCNFNGWYGLASHPISTPVTLQVSGFDKSAKQMYVYLVRVLQRLIRLLVHNGHHFPPAQPPSPYVSPCLLAI